jgi:L-lysine 2,3-aminomutase
MEELERKLSEWRIRANHFEDLANVRKITIDCLNLRVKELEKAGTNVVKRAVMFKGIDNDTVKAISTLSEVLRFKGS